MLHPQEIDFFEDERVLDTFVLQGCPENGRTVCTHSIRWDWLLGRTIPCGATIAYKVEKRRGLRAEQRSDLEATVSTSLGAAFLSKLDLGLKGKIGTSVTLENTVAETDEFTYAGRECYETKIDVFQLQSVLRLAIEWKPFVGKMKSWSKVIYIDHNRIHQEASCSPKHSSCGCPQAEEQVEYAELRAPDLSMLEPYIVHHGQLYFFNLGLYVASGELHTDFRREIWPPARAAVVDEAFGERAGNAVAVLEQAPVPVSLQALPGHLRHLAGYENEGTALLRFRRASRRQRPTRRVELEATRGADDSPPPLADWTQSTSLSRVLGEHIVREKEAHDLSRNPEFARFQFLGYRTSAVAVELVALCDADGLTEGDVVRLRDEFFGLVRRLPHDYGLKPRGRNPNGLLGFVFADGCPEHMARFIGRQTRIDHAAGTGGVSVAWAIDVPNGRIHTHDNPVSIFPPVIVAARTVYPGLDWLESLLPRLPALAQAPHSPPDPRMHDTNAGPSAYNVFLSYASEDGDIAEEIARALTDRGVRVWMDRLVLNVGDSIRQSVDHGLANSRFGIVLLSPHYFQKQWPQHELNGLLNRQINERRTVVLPVWHQIDADAIRRHSPMLADRMALRTSDGIPRIVSQVVGLVSSSPVQPPGGGDPGKTRILFLAANSMTRPMDLEREWERIETNLRLAKERDRVIGIPVLAASMDRLMQAMLDESPTLVHFSGHGRTEGIVMRTEGKEMQLVPGEALARLFALFKDTLRCVVLNACWSETQARAIRQHVPHVVGMLQRIKDEDAVAFSVGFYKAIAAGRDVPFAFEMGAASVHARGTGGEKNLVLL